MDLIGIAAIISAFATPAVVVFTTVWTNRKVDAVQHEVKTINAQSLAQLADAGETRRIEAKPVSARTWEESDHLHSVEAKKREDA